jgi:hypothetical protein
MALERGRRDSAEAGPDDAPGPRRDVVTLAADFRPPLSPEGALAMARLVRQLRHRLQGHQPEERTA